ncbi:polycystin-1-related protein-like [Amphiura filiformis]|uniref:polycystin-1-related protein-like n=1 Tax=Amphiura filiformis TaxID=82378 RepID=UPI003B223A31
MAMWLNQRDGEDVKINVTNHFMTIGTYSIQITASNLVSSITGTLLQVVLKPDCFPPEVLFEEKKCNPHFPCTDGYRQFKASETAIVSSRIKPKCKSSKSVWFSWRIYKVIDLGTGEEEFYNDKLSNATILEGASLRDLAIRGPVFEYGKYRFEVNVSMSEEVGIFTIEETYIYITKSPLVAKIAGGYYRTAGWNSYDIIDAISETYDPDKTGEARKEGFEFTWFCRRKKYWQKTINGTTVIDEVETFEEWNEYYDKKSANGTVNQLFVDAQKPGDQYGCFGLSETGDIPLPGGRISQTGDNLLLNTSSMYYDMEYEIKVVVKKDTRIAIAYQIKLILEGEPPSMSINCKLNCLNKCNPSNRYAVESEEMFAGSSFADLYFRWNIQILLNDTIPPIWGMVDQQNWLPYTSTGDKKVNFVIEAGFFQDNEVYFLELIASRNPNLDNAGNMKMSYNVYDVQQCILQQSSMEMSSNVYYNNPAWRCPAMYTTTIKHEDVLQCILRPSSMKMSSNVHYDNQA